MAAFLASLDLNCGVLSGQWIVVASGQRTWYEATLFEETWFLYALSRRTGVRRTLPILFTFPFQPAKARLLGGMLLNELKLSGLLSVMLEQAGPRIAPVLRAIADPKGLPSITFCSAGKDRTVGCGAFRFTQLGVPLHDVVRLTVADTVFSLHRD